MLSNFLVWFVVLSLTGTIIWFVLRARRSARAGVKWTGLLGGGFVALILLVVAATSTRGLAMLYAPRGRPVRDLTVDRSPERVERGRRIANALCVGCHSLNGELPLSGGRNLSEEAGAPLGDLYPLNLTPAGLLAGWTDGQIFRAIRDGADDAGRRLPVMSAQRARYLSDYDIESVIAYLRSQPAVSNETPPPRPSFLTAIMAGANMLPLLPGLAPDTIVAPPRDTTLVYGQYVTQWMGCDECHGAQYTGGGGGVLPKGPSLRSVKGWSRDGFIAAMRTGTTPFGRKLDTLLMPWKFVGRLSDDELTAMHAYLTSLD